MPKYFCQLALLAACPLLGHAVELTLGPNSNGGSGVLPSGYSRISFQTADGDWTKTIVLPVNPRDKDVVSLRASAGWDSGVDAVSTSFRVRSLRVVRGDAFEFTYNAASRLWAVESPGIRALTPNANGASIADSAARLTRYSLRDADWVPEVFLPKVAKEGDLIAIASDAAWGSKVNTDNALFASTLTLKAGDAYVFSYRANFGKWVPEYAPVRLVPAASSILPQTSPRATMLVSDAAYVADTGLPASAGDRDRISIRSDATWKTRIRNQYVNFEGPMTLQRGQEYEFLYIKEDARWELMRSPDTVYQARNLSGGVLPSLLTPRTVVRSANANWVPNLVLPTSQKKGARVVVESGAELPFVVTSSGLNSPVRPGETKAFIVDASGKWVQETVTIDLLLLYSDKIASQMGDSAARARMYESFALTNEALENSGANFRFRIAALRKFSAPSTWTGLEHAADQLRTHAMAQQWRNELKADGIFYEGSESGCGLAWIKANAVNMVATGSTNCGTTVMRHETGHNMGLAHGDSTDAGYAKGHSAIGSIMGGNAIPYYASPRRFTADQGIRMGIVDKIDAVRAMNEFSAQVAAYR
jgi:hypothetical protein